MGIKRRELFKTLATPFKKREEPAPIRPPYNAAPELFTEHCPTCDTKPCIASCDEEIIFALEDGTVALDFSRRGCTYCDACAQACEKGVLKLQEPPAPIQAQILLDKTACIAWHQVICRSCADVCYDQAIKFLGMLRPEILPDACTQCGFCIGVCPSQAIQARPPSLKKESS